MMAAVLVARAEPGPPDACDPLESFVSACAACGGRLLARSATRAVAAFATPAAAAALVASLSGEARGRLGFAAGLAGAGALEAAPLAATEGLVRLAAPGRARATAAFREALGERLDASLGSGGTAAPPFAGHVRQAGGAEAVPVFDLLASAAPDARTPARRPQAPAPGEGDRPSVLATGFAAEDGASPALAAALREDLVDRLGRFRDLTVLAGETGRLQGLAAGSADAAAAALGADYAVSGRLRAEGRGLRVSARLVEAATGRVVWSDWLTREADALTDAGAALADGLAAAFATGVERDLRRRPRRRPDAEARAEGRAWRLAAEGAARLREGEREAGEALIDAALALGPASSRALRAKAEARLAARARAARPEAEVERARRCAAEAVAADPLDARASAILGRALLAAGEPQEAAEALARAEALNPNDPEALLARAFALVAVNEPEAAATRALRAMALHPFFPDEAPIALAAARFAEGDAEAAAEALARLAAPDLARPLAAAVFGALGDAAAAERAVEAGRAAAPEARLAWGLSLPPGPAAEAHARALARILSPAAPAGAAPEAGLEPARPADPRSPR